MNEKPNETGSPSSELSLAQITSLLSEQVNEKIEELESFMLTQEQVEIPAKHLFVAGMYAREIVIPKGTLLTGRVWKDGYIDIMLSGDIAVATPSGVKRLQGVNIMEGMPGRKRAGYAYQDTRWLTVHKTDIQKDNQILDALTFFTMAEYTQDRVANDTVSFDRLLTKLGVTDEDIQPVVQNTKDMIALSNEYAEIVSLKPSTIHGVGLFAERAFHRGNVICPARINNMRTIGGRYSNHSELPNARMVFDGRDIELVAIRAISLGDEITTNYEHTLSMIQESTLCQQ